MDEVSMTMTSTRPSTSAAQSGQEPTTSGFGTSRPASRRSNGSVSGYPSRMATGRPESRIMEQDRPMSKIARLQSAVRPGTSMRMGSALRIGTARPPTAATTGIPAHAQVNLMDRPMTQQGVSGLRTATRTAYGNRRMVHDKTYYVGLVHTKIGEISSEITKLLTQIESLGKEQSTYLTYEKRVKELAAELLELQGELSDYNLLSDALVTGKGRVEIEEELKQIIRENKLLSQKIETIFTRRRETEKHVLELEEQIETERTKSDRLVETLNEPMRDKYESIREENANLQEEMTYLQSQLDDLTLRREEMFVKICNSDLNRRAAQLEEEYLEVLGKRDELLRESSSRETPDEERNRLSHQVKTDNAEIATLERQITELHEELRLSENELKALEQEIEDSDSERQQKFRELKKKEDDIDAFMLTFEEMKSKELEAIKKLETEILATAERVSKNYQLTSALPEGGLAGKSFAEMQEDFQFKMEETDKARLTTEIIEAKNDSLKKQLNEFEGLQEKLHSELLALESRMEDMKEEMIKFEDIDRAKSEAAEKTSRLQKERKLWEEKLRQVSDLLKVTQIDHDKVQTELVNNEVYRQLKNLEKKWVALEQSNYELSSYMTIKRNETNYEDIKANALKLVEDYNKLLQDRFLL